MTNDKWMIPINLDYVELTTLRDWHKQRQEALFQEAETHRRRAEEIDRQLIPHTETFAGVRCA